MLQAALATWFFSAVEGAACGAAVGIATLPVALFWRWRSTRAKAPGVALASLGLAELQDGTQVPVCTNTGAEYTLMAEDR